MIRIIVFILFFSSAAAATADSMDNLHIKSAFFFAHKKAWGTAINEARAGHSPVLAKYFTWSYLKDPQADADFDSINAFIDQNPAWPDQTILLKRAEVALLASSPNDAMLDEWYAKHPPQTGLARRLEARNEAELQALIRESWVSDEYSKAAEAKFLARYHGMLKTEDFVRRIDRLLWESKNDEARRLLKYVPYDQQRLFQARLALAEDRQRSPIELVNVAPALRSDPGLTYERIRWRLKHDDKAGVRDLLLSTPQQVPYAEKWWPLRDRQIREALGEGNPKLALQLLARHGQKTDSVSYKEEQWLEGWIALQYSHKPDKAYTIMSALHKTLTAPASKSRAAYWAGRAASALGKKSSSVRWFEEAARYPTTFYGQLAAWETNPYAMLDLRPDREPTRAQKERFHRLELVQLVHALALAQESDAAGKFILHLVESASSPEDAVLATELGGDIGRIDLGVRAAKKALQADVLSLDSGWPVIRFAGNGQVETPLLLALSRQESEFNADAVSPSGALGLMQLLPGTAREMARKNDLPYSSDRLFQPAYNMTVGSLYLGKMLDRFSGSYVLATASYNAGPGRVGQWLEMYGRPGASVHETVDWIERIPTAETRNYVQHVLENVEVYRYILSGKSSSRLMIAEDISR